MPRHNLRSVAIAVLVVGLLSSACGEERPFENLGDLSRDFVYGDTSTTTTAVVDDDGDELPVGLVTSTDRRWWSDDAGSGEGRDPQAVTSSVWSRGNGAERFIPASRSEIASALEEIMFPELVPEPVEWITSQLVFDVASGTLDAGSSAAFGLWSDTPYTVERAEGQMAILRVGTDVPACPTGTDVCPELEEAESIRAEIAEQGINLRWVEGDYEYELFCRTPQQLPEQLCREMAESMAPLSILLGTGSSDTDDTSAAEDAGS